MKEPIDKDDFVNLMIMMEMYNEFKKSFENVVDIDMNEIEKAGAMYE
jgi:hypothetical protein